MVTRTSEQIAVEIKATLGFVPPFFQPAFGSPRVLENLWFQTKSAYLENPLPDLFKEKLAALLGRYCTVPYCLICHSSSLRPLGMKSSEILALLQKPALGFKELAEKTADMPQIRIPEDTWPEPGSLLEEHILFCCVAVFLSQDTEQCLEKLRVVLGAERFDNLVMYLAYNRTCLQWAEAHPELSYEADQRVKDNLESIVSDEPAIQNFFENYQGKVNEQADRRTQWLTQEYKSLLLKEKSLRQTAEESNLLIRSLLHSTAEGIWGIATDGRITFVNPAAVRLFGFDSAEQMVGQHSHELVHSRKPDGTAYREEDCPIMRAFNARTSLRLDDEVFWRKDGTSFYADYSATPIFDAGKFTGAVATFEDTTERRKVLKELQANQSWLAGTLRGIADAVIATDASEHACISFMNEVAEKLTGWTLVEAKGRPVLEVFNIFNEHTRVQAVSPVGKVLATGTTQKPEAPTILMSRNGHEYLIENNAAPITELDGALQGVVLVFRDVTNEKQLQRERDEANKRVQIERQQFKMMLEQAPLPLAMFAGSNNHFEYANDAYRKLFIGDHDYIGKSLEDILPEAKQQGFNSMFEKVLNTGKTVSGNEVSFCFAQGGRKTREYFFNFIYEPMKSPSGKTEGVLAVIADVTEQVIARQKIEEAANSLFTERQKLETMFAQATVGFALLRGPTFIFEKANAEFEKLVSERDYIGRTWQEVYAELPNSPLYSSLEHVYKTGEVYRAEALKVRVQISKDVYGDTYFDVVYSRISGSDKEAYGILIQCENVTERITSGLRIEQSEKDLVDTLESMSDAFFSVDANWNITRANAQMEKIVKISKADQIGNNFLDLLLYQPQHRQTKFWEKYHEAMNKRIPVSFEEFYEPLSIWVRVRAYPKSDGGLAVFYSDITESKLAQQALIDSEYNFRSIADAAPEMVFTCTPDGLIDYINPRWYEYTGKTEQETLGTGYASVIHPDDVEATMQNWQHAVDTGTRFVVEHRFCRGADGAYRWFLARTEPKFENGRLIRWYGTITDIHDQKTFSEQLAAARDAAERANQTKSSFLANMSHEIRTPLGAIIGFSEMLRDESVDDTERRSFVDVINRNAKSLTRIIDDILDLSKVEAGRLDIELLPVSLREILGDVLELFSDRVKATGVALTATMSDAVPEKIESDPVRLRQILVNIVGNAIKFTEKGFVAITVDVVGSGPEYLNLKISVKDTGRGLNQEQKEKLFKPFSQADNTTTREYGGTGLGLVLSKRLAEALGGTVAIEDCAPNLGCTFTITFNAKPLRAQASAVRNATRAVTGVQQNRLAEMKILVVEDSPDNQVLLKRILTRNGATVVLASDGYQGANRALEGDFDVVLMDIQMPIMDGYTAMARLQGSKYDKPVVALTAHAMEEERARTEQAGFAAHVTKPIDFVNLVNTIVEISRKPELNSYSL